MYDYCLDITRPPRIPHFSTLFLTTRLLRCNPCHEVSRLMAQFPCLSMSFFNLEPPYTRNQCSVAMRNSLPSRHLPPATLPLQSPRSHWPLHQTSGSRYNPAPTASSSGLLFLTLPSSLNQSQQVPFQFWTSNRRHALQPVLAMVCVPPAGRALVPLVSPVPRVNLVRTVSSAPSVNPVHRTVPNVTRGSQAPAFVLPLLSRTCRQPATV